MRLSKALSEAGVASRRAAEKLIQEGKIQVNGKVIFLPQEQVSWKEDQILYNGKKLFPPKKYYFLFHKPKKTVSSCQRKDQERLVTDFFPEHYRLFPIGRLDKNTTGLLLMTNDGDFCHKVIHPSSNLEKEYFLQSPEPILDKAISLMKKGIFIDGRKIRPVKIIKLNKYTLSIVIKEGKKHEVRLLAKKANISVQSLKRIRIGNLRLGNLKEGDFRELSLTERSRIFGS